MAAEGVGEVSQSISSCQLGLGLGVAYPLQEFGSKHAVRYGRCSPFSNFVHLVVAAFAPAPPRQRHRYEPVRGGSSLFEMQL